MTRLICFNAILRTALAVVASLALSLICCTAKPRQEAAADAGAAAERLPQPGGGPLRQQGPVQEEVIRHRDPPDKTRCLSPLFYLQ